MKTCLIPAAFAAAVILALGGGTTRAEEPATGVASNEIATIDLAALSNVNHNLFARDPFWPVGYVPRALRPEEEIVPVTPDAPEVKRPPKETKVEWPEPQLNGIVKTPAGKLAMMRNIGVVAEGAEFSMMSHGYIFEWRMDQIDVENQTVATKRLGYRRAE